jgi:hypothetical protein
MEIVIRPIYQHSVPPRTKRRVGFIPMEEADLVSATANPSSTGPLFQIASSYGWNFGKLKSASKKCNKYQSLALIDQNPSLVLVPRTNGDSDTGVILEDLTKVIRESGAKVINFTHYGFLNQRLPSEEITKFFSAIILSDFGKASVAFVDIESMFYNEFVERLEIAQHSAQSFVSVGEYSTRK